MTEAQNDENLAETYKKLNEDQVINNSFSEGNTSISESNSYSKVIISELLDTSKDKIEINCNIDNNLNNEDILFEKEKVFDMDDVSLKKRRKNDKSENSSIDLDNNKEKIVKDSFNSHRDLKDLTTVGQIIGFDTKDDRKGTKDTKENSSNSTKDTKESESLIKYDSLE